MIAGGGELVAEWKVMVVMQKINSIEAILRTPERDLFAWIQARPETGELVV